MSKRTDKAGTSGRYGARYGVVVRNRIRSIEQHQKAKHECPECHHRSVRRVSAGIWECKHCGNKFAAGAYTPRTKNIVNETVASKAAKTAEDEAAAAANAAADAAADAAEE